MASSNKNTKWNLSELDLVNEAADFPRFVVIESLEEVYLAKFLLFLIEKVISTRATVKTVKETKNVNLLVDVDNWRQAESILKMKTFHTTKCRAYLNEKLNTSKGVIRSRKLALATEEEIALALGKQGVINIRTSIRKSKEWIQTNIYIWHLISPILPRRWRSAFVLRELSRISQYPWGASNAKNMDITGKPLEDDRHVLNAVKRTQTTWKKITWSKLGVLPTRSPGLHKIL